MNLLSKEKSPYLLQHQHNPVDWYPWGEEAFLKAKKENKLVFLSIGYSTCHWCHVMEKDSFEKAEVAGVLNKNFVCIKVDREERPDVDHLYMEAVVALTGRGGWPMSVFLTPDKKPFFGGTFFWKDQFIGILNQLHSLWVKNPEEIFKAQENLVGHLNEDGQIVGAIHESPLRETINDTLTRASEMFLINFDSVHGGFGGAPKFPKSIDLLFLLGQYERKKNGNLLGVVTKTLDSMARGGIYDHLGYGFARYSVDSYWLIPHFEKMLYDNALLSMAYAEAYRVTKNKMYQEVSAQTLDYILNNMASSEGAFYSAEDADSEGEEGKFYVWSESELKNILTDDEFKIFSQVYRITSEGNFEHNTNVLSLSPSTPWDIKNHPLLLSAHKKLLEVREKRIHPFKDDKILTSWNALMIAGLAINYRVFGNKNYLEAALKSFSFIEKKLIQNDELLVRFRDGEAKFSGTLTEYTFFIFALLELYKSTCEEQFLNLAKKFQKKTEELFGDPVNGGFFYASEKASDLFTRKKEWYDGAIPSGNNMALLNLISLFYLTNEKKYQEEFEKNAETVLKKLKQYPAGFATGLLAFDLYLNGFKEALACPIIP